MSGVAQQGPKVCVDCGARLARDNPGVRCSPCQRGLTGVAFSVDSDMAAPGLLGPRLKELRLAHVPPLSQFDLAVQADLSESLIKKLEQGTRDIGRMSTLRQLAAALGTDVPSLLAPVGAPAVIGGAARTVRGSAGRTGQLTAHSSDAGRPSNGQGAPLAEDTDSGGLSTKDGLRVETAGGRRRTRLAEVLAEWPLTHAEAIERFNTTARALKVKVTVSPRQFSRWVLGEGTAPRPAARRVLEAAFELPVNELLAQLPDETTLDSEPVPLSGLDRLRVQALELLHGDNPVAASSLDDWARTIEQHGIATRYVGSADLLPVLTRDFADLQQYIARRPSLSAMRLLNHASARLAGLLSLTLLKTGQAESSREWSKAAWLISLEVGDPSTSSWVRAQDAYSFFYDKRIREAISTARHAQDAANGRPSVGFVLAAALEARAQAVLGRQREALAAIYCAEEALGRLDSESSGESAFGYDEAQLRFHQSNALTRLGDFDGAMKAQQQALSLYHQDNYMDRALVLLDRAELLARLGDVQGAIDEVTSVVGGLAPEQRDGLIVARALDVREAFEDSARRDELVWTISALTDDTPRT